MCVRVCVCPGLFHRSSDSAAGPASPGQEGSIASRLGDVSISWVSLAVPGTGGDPMACLPWRCAVFVRRMLALPKSSSIRLGFNPRPCYRLGAELELPTELLHCILGLAAPKETSLGPDQGDRDRRMSASSPVLVPLLSLQSRVIEAYPGPKIMWCWAEASVFLQQGGCACAKDGAGLHSCQDGHWGYWADLRAWQCPPLSPLVEQRDGVPAALALVVVASARSSFAASSHWTSLGMGGDSRVVPSVHPRKASL